METAGTEPDKNTKQIISYLIRRHFIAS
jgi:hypothetical protein